MNVDNSNNIQKSNPPHTLKFNTPEENKGRSIFLQDDNNIVEINDIKGNGSKDFMEKLKAFLQPAADAGQSWTQELIDGAE